ncbi:hypothetical protein PuT2_14740 [Pusillimonas sp. T2]|uniref:phage Gp37/Gp68 family protein n=1 Tax=Pusillimonas sp. T2 TaxID=1548123 RepID=UPI000B8B2AAA|nr:phage Gp37/Gp68 family protein [Pusillimonas sp. T2]OXR48052.1 hypothetical protein PuT2_14740 [Pusillimonas sp. T2]
MSETTNIEWCDSTFNPWIGCNKVSPGCDHCYAEQSTPARVLDVKWGAKVARRRTSASNWRKPLAWNNTHAQFYAEHGRRRRVFCASLADVFDNAVDPQWREDLFELIDCTPNLDWLILTKRISNAHPLIMDALNKLARRRGQNPNELQATWPWPNVWLGATIVNDEEAHRDIPKLLETPAAVRFLSMEPLLSSVSLRWLTAWRDGIRSSALNPTGQTDHLDGLRQLDWVIVGGESGPNARPMHPDWARALRDQCAEAGVPFFFKQWGEYVVPEDGARSCRVCGCTWNNACEDSCWWIEPDLCSSCVGKDAPAGDRPVRYCKVGKKAAGRLLDGQKWDHAPSK